MLHYSAIYPQALHPGQGCSGCVRWEYTLNGTPEHLYLLLCYYYVIIFFMVSIYVALLNYLTNR